MLRISSVLKPSLFAVAALVFTSGQAVAQSRTVTNAEVIYNDDGTISVSLTISDTNPTALDFVVNPPTADRVDNCISTGNSLEQALSNYEASCDIPVDDCDPYDGLWYCSNVSMSEKPVLQVVEVSDSPELVVADDGSAGDTTSSEQQPDEDQAERDTTANPAVIVTLPAPTATPTTDAGTDNDGEPGARANIGKIAAGDLLALHYDNAPDPDDGHALVAGRVLTDYFGLESVIAVNGAYGYLRRGNFNQNSESLFEAAWPSGLNAFRDREGSVATSAALWSSTISQGGNVWVAEGGPSDFTADVLRAMPEGQRKSVTVVQHSHGWNEDNTRDDNVAYVINQANYVRIDNGNLDGNSTADLNRQSASFVQVALASQWGELWQAAFNYLNPAERLDFSDTVEFLWLLDIPLSQVADPDDFADEFLR